MKVKTMKNNLENNFLDFIESHNLLKEESTIKNINYIIKNGKTNIGVIIKDWKRAIGVDTIIQAERTMKNTPLISQIFILTNKYSDPAKALATRISLPLFTPRELENFHLEGK